MKYFECETERSLEDFSTIFQSGLFCSNLKFKEANEKQTEKKEKEETMTTKMNNLYKMVSEKLDQNKGAAPEREEVFKTYG